jgi:hypothetical protein
MQKLRSQQRWRGVAAASLVWLFGMGTLYRETLTSGFEVLHGGNLDQRLLIYLSEHWYRVLGGDAAWRDPSAFYPVTNDLGYSDSLVLFQLAYVPLRWMGLDQFVAFEVTLMALTTIGFVAMVVLVHWVFRVHFVVAVAAAYVFAFGNHIAVQTQHGQLLAVELVPVVALGVAGSVALMRQQQQSGAGVRAGVRAGLVAGATGALTGLIMFTSFYIGWFMVALGVLTAVCVTVCAPALARTTVQRIRGHVGHLAVLVVGFAVGLATALIPFALTYAATLEVSGGRTFDEVLYFTPRAVNLAHFGDGNLLWGQVLPRLPGVSSDVIAVPSPTPVLAVTAAIGLLVMLVHVRGDAHRRAMQQRLQVAAGLMLAAVLATAAGLRVGQWTAWRWVWHYVPGATAIRVPGRIGMLTAFVVVVAWALVADAVWSTIRPWFGASTARRVAAGAIAMIAVAVAVEQVQSNSVHDLLRSQEVALVNSVGPTPAGCVAFYAVDPQPSNPPWVDQMDAMLVSHAAGIPTLNGYSGLEPPGWALDDPDDPNYYQAARAWIERYDLGDTVCTFALAERKWGTPPP